MGYHLLPAESCRTFIGYDWVDGNLHRHVIFFRDKAQEDFDHNQLFPPKDAFVDPVKHLSVRYATINHLKKKFNLTETLVHDFLSRECGFRERRFLVTVSRWWACLS